MELNIEHLTKRYGKKTALDDVCSVLTNGIYGLLGPNGAGKSTLMKILTDNLAPDSGRVLLDGTPVVEMGAQYRALLGYMPQQQGLYPHFTARRFLYYIAALKGESRRQAEREIERTAALVNLTDVLDKRLGTFSGGMKQRVLIAQAILGDPGILILDEPTAGLDPEERIRIRNLISRISMDRIVILATHVVSDVEYVAREIMMLKNGCLIAQASPAVLLQGMKGRVFELSVPEDQLEALQGEYRVGNIRKDENDKVWLRVVADGRPDAPQVREAAPALEDVYLYTFEGPASKGGSA